MTDDLERVERALAQRVAGDNQRGDVYTRREVVITAVNADGTVDITLGGQPIPGVKRYSHYTPLVGDSAFLEFSGNDPIVVGRVAAVPYWPNVMEFGNSADGATTSTSFVDWPTVAPVTFTHRKLLAATELLVMVQVAVRSDTAFTTIETGIRIDATDYPTRLAAFDVANVHDDVTAYRRVMGLAAGLHTFTMRLRSVNGATVRCDANDRQTVVVQEIPVPITS